MGEIYVLSKFIYMGSLDPVVLFIKIQHICSNNYAFLKYYI